MECQVQVYSATLGGHPCPNSAKVQDPTGWHCGTHSDEAKATRKAKRNATWKQRWDGMQKAWERDKEQARRAGCYAGLVEALEEIAWPLKDEPACSGVKVLPKTVSDLREIATNALAEARKGVPK